MEQLKLMEGYGANCVYITDSAGYMLPDDVSARIALARQKLDPATEIGFHGHHNLGMGIANSLAAVEAGAKREGSQTGAMVIAGLRWREQGAEGVVLRLPGGATMIQLTGAEDRA